MKIGIIGFGRFGKLLSTILKRSHKVSVFDIKNKAKEAEGLGVKWATLGEVCSQDLVIFCVPISEMEKALKRTKTKIKKGAIVMDTCSVKAYPAKLMRRYLPRNVETVASHPMFGPDSAKYGLNGLHIVLYPLRIKKQSFDAVKDVFKVLGLKIIEMTPEEHDKQSAWSLCLVHFLGRGLEKIKINPQKITTLGFERLLKVQETVTNDTWQLFRDMQKYNKFAKLLREKILAALTEINKKLDKS